MKICWDTLIDLNYIGEGVWVKQLENRKIYYIEMASCLKCDNSFLTDKYVPKKFCSHSCSMKKLFIKEGFKCNEAGK